MFKRLSQSYPTPQNRCCLHLKLVFILLWGLLFFAGCQSDPLDLRLDPSQLACYESSLSLSGDFAALSDSVVETPVSLALLQEYLDKMENQRAALGGRRYIIHFYHRGAEYDRELIPAKFPLFWEIDSTQVQTEGIFLLKFESASQLAVTFGCDTCAQIDLQAQRVKPQGPKPKRIEFKTGTDSRPSTEDWAFRLRPRKIQLEEEVGNSYLVKIESQESYIASAKAALKLEEVGKRYHLSYEEPLDYNAERYVNGIVVAMVNDDRAQRQKAISKVLAQLQPQLDSLKTAGDSLAGLLVGDGKSGAAQAAWAQNEAALKAIQHQKDYWVQKYGAFIPRFIASSPARPCKPLQ